MIENLGERMFKCTYCEKTFTQQRYRTRHEIHQCLLNPNNPKNKEIKSYTCRVCGASYSQEKSLNFHVRHDCSRIHHCDNCGQTFLQYCSLKTHLKSGICKI